MNYKRLSVLFLIFIVAMFSMALAAETDDFYVIDFAGKRDDGRYSMDLLNREGGAVYNTVPNLGVPLGLEDSNSIYGRGMPTFVWARTDSSNQITNIVEVQEGLAPRNPNEYLGQYSITRVEDGAKISEHRVYTYEGELIVDQNALFYLAQAETNGEGSIIDFNLIVDDNRENFEEIILPNNTLVAYNPKSKHITYVFISEKLDPKLEWGKVLEVKPAKELIKIDTTEATILNTNSDTIPDEDDLVCYTSDNQGVVTIKRIFSMDELDNALVVDGNKVADWEDEDLEDLIPLTQGEFCLDSDYAEWKNHHKYSVYRVNLKGKIDENLKVVSVEKAEARGHDGVNEIVTADGYNWERIMVLDNEQSILVFCGPFDEENTTSGGKLISIEIPKEAEEPVEADNGGIFPDVPDSHWASEAIKVMVERNIINGYPDGTFRPTRFVTREEYAKILVSALTNMQNNDFGINFEDIEQDRWSKDFIEKASLYFPVFKKEGKYYFKPTEESVREDVITTAVYALDLQRNEYNQETLKIFKDSADISPLIKKYIAIAIENDLIHGDERAMINPKKKLTRAELSQFVYNILQRLDSNSNDNTSEEQNGKIKMIKAKDGSINKFVQKLPKEKYFILSFNGQEITGRAWSGQEFELFPYRFNIIDMEKYSTKDLVGQHTIASEVVFMQARDYGFEIEKIKDDTVRLKWEHEGNIYYADSKITVQEDGEYYDLATVNNFICFIFNTTPGVTITILRNNAQDDYYEKVMLLDEVPGEVSSEPSSDQLESNENEQQGQNSQNTQNSQNGVQQKWGLITSLHNIKETVEINGEQGKLNKEKSVSAKRGDIARYIYDEDTYEYTLTKILDLSQINNALIVDRNTYLADDDEDKDDRIPLTNKKSLTMNSNHSEYKKHADYETYGVTLNGKSGGTLTVSEISQNSNGHDGVYNIVSSDGYYWERILILDQEKTIFVFCSNTFDEYTQNSQNSPNSNVQQKWGLITGINSGKETVEINGEQGNLNKEKSVSAYRGDITRYIYDEDTYEYTLTKILNLSQLDNALIVDGKGDKGGNSIPLTDKKSFTMNSNHSDYKKHADYDTYEVTLKAGSDGVITVSEVRQNSNGHDGVYNIVSSDGYYWERILILDQEKTIFVFCSNFFDENTITSNGKVIKEPVPNEPTDWEIPEPTEEPQPGIPSDPEPIPSDPTDWDDPEPTEEPKPGIPSDPEPNSPGEPAVELPNPKNASLYASKPSGTTLKASDTITLNVTNYDPSFGNLEFSFYNESFMMAGEFENGFKIAVKTIIDRASSKNVNLYGQSLKLELNMSEYPNQITTYKYTVERPALLGDANEDGEINMKDSLAIQQHLAGKTTLSTQGQKNADVNADGVVSFADAQILLQYDSGWNVTLPYKDYVNYGDVNDDGTINGKDSIALAKYVTDKGFLTTQGKKNADVNNDKKVNQADIDVLDKYLAGQFSELPHS